MPGLLALIVWRPSTKSPPTTPGALQSAACYPDRVRTSLGGIPVSAHSPSADAEATMAASSERRAAIWERTPCPHETELLGRKSGLLLAFRKKLLEQNA